MKWLALVVLVTGCKFAPPGASTDATTGGGGDDDDAAILPDTTVELDAFVLGAWGTPTLVAEVNSGQNDDDPTLTADMLELYFASQRLPESADEDIYVAKRSALSAPFGTPVLVPGINTTTVESNVDISGDGLFLMFSSGRNGNVDLYFSTRVSRDSEWSTPALAPGLNSFSGEFGAVVSADILEAVLCSNRDGNEALFRAQRTASSNSFGTPVKLTELDTAQNECDGMLPAPDTLYFTRDRADGNRDLDLFLAHKTAGSFDAGTNITELNTTSRDGDPWVSPDQRTMFFASNRPSMNGPDDIYVSTR